MINIYRTDDRIISELEEFEPGSWINLTAPTLEECADIADKFNMDVADVRAALDDEESSRISLEDEYTLILVDIPSAEVRNNRHTYTTIPLGILLSEGVVITVCSEETSVLRGFVEHRVRDFSTKKQMKFVYQILYNACMVYQSLLRNIDRKRTELEERIEDDMEVDDKSVSEMEIVVVVVAERKNGDWLFKIVELGRFERDAGESLIASS